MLTHHAYYVEGSLSQFAALQAALHPLWASAFERFGIDEARELIALSSLKNYADVTYLIGASTITSEAQQALLKLFEEPQPGTHFVLLVPHGVLLPTLRSRMLAWDTEQLPGQKSLPAGRQARVSRPDYFSELSTAFLRASGKERSDMIAKMLKDDPPRLDSSRVEAGEGVKERVRDFLDGLEALLAKKIQDKTAQEGLQDIAMVRDYLRDRSPSLKMLLEHLALSLPVV